MTAAENKRADNSRPKAAGYRLCVYASGSLITDMLFIDARDKRYRKFYKQLNKLPLEEQLSAINYIIFSYSENVYISKSIDESILTNEHFVATCQKSSIATASHPFGNALNAAVAEFSLSKRNEIPNLLSEEFRLA